MLEHNDEYVHDMHGDNCWDSLDEVMEEFSKLVLSDALIQMRPVNIQPDCGTLALRDMQDRIDNAVKDAKC